MKNNKISAPNFHYGLNVLIWFNTEMKKLYWATAGNIPLQLIFKQNICVFQFGVRGQGKSVTVQA